jgi:purine-binding chemotaxis protein CheW
MVDLVKIRKKAKEKQGLAVGAQEAAKTATPEATTRASEHHPSVAPKKPAKHEGPTWPAAARKESSAPPNAAAAPANVPANAESVAADVPPPSDPQPKRATKLDRFKELAGKWREDADVAGATAEASEHVASEGQLEVLTFAIAGENYGIDIEHIVEIVPPRTPTRVPNADPSIVGILSLRGTIVTLVDVRRRLKQAKSGVTPETRIVVVEHGGETIGFEVDRVFRVVKIAPSDVAPHPVVHASELDESIRGVFRQGDALTIMLDFDKLLDRREMPRAGALESLVSH